MSTHEKIIRLLNIAYGDTGGSKRVAQFLLSLWNGNRYRADLQDLLYIDKDIFDDMMYVMKDLYLSNMQLNSYLKDDDIKPVIEDWGNQFRYRRS